MKAHELRMKHKMERAKRKRELQNTVIMAAITSVVMIAFTVAGLRAWDKEMESTAKYNNEYQHQMEMRKLDK